VYIHIAIVIHAVAQAVWFTTVTVGDRHR